MVSPMTALAVTAAALLCAVFASPVPADDGRDANASAPSNFLNCANGVGSGNGFNNCSIPAAPSGVPSLPSGVPSLPSGVPSLPSGVPSLPSGVPSLPSGVPSLPSGVPSLPSGVPSLPSGVPSLPSGVPSQPPSINQGVECATAIGQGNGINNCSSIFIPAGGSSSGSGSSRMED